MIIAQKTVYDCVPPGYERVAFTEDETAFLNTHFNKRVNVVVMARPHLTGNFRALAQAMAAHYGLNDQTTCLVLELPQISQYAAINEAQPFQAELKTIQQDLNFAIDNNYRNARLRLVKRYPNLNLNFETQGEHPEEIHPDETDPNFGRLMVCYDSPATEFIPNDDIQTFGESPIVKPGYRAFSLPLRSIWKHAGYDTESAQVQQQIENAAYHRGVAAPHFCLRLSADKIKPGPT